MKTISNAKLRALEAKGKVNRKQPEPTRPAPEPAVERDSVSPEIIERNTAAVGAQTDALSRQADAIQRLATDLHDGQLSLAEKITTMVMRNNEDKEPVPYRFVVKRNRKNLIEEIEAYPITED